jgi:hypothetical protein
MQDFTKDPMKGINTGGFTLPGDEKFWTLSRQIVATIVPGILLMLCVIYYTFTYEIKPHEMAVVEQIDGSIHYHDGSQSIMTFGSVTYYAKVTPMQGKVVCTLKDGAKVEIRFTYNCRLLDNDGAAIHKLFGKWSMAVNEIERLWIRSLQNKLIHETRVSLYKMPPALRQQLLKEATPELSFVSINSVYLVDITFEFSVVDQLENGIFKIKSEE